MNSSQVFDAIEQIAATSSKLEKEKLVKEGMQWPLFAQACKLAYNPTINFGVAGKTLQGITGTCAPGAGLEFDAETETLLSWLADRELTGQSAVHAIAVEFARLNEKSAQLLRRVLMKDLRAGFSESTINKAAPGSVPDFPYMRCSLPPKSNMDKWLWDAGIISQEKADGMFANIDHEASGLVRVTSRQGSEFPLYALGKDFETAVQELLFAETQTHGELLVRQGGAILPREISNGILNSLLNGGALEDGQEVIFFAWDAIPLWAVKPKGKYARPYIERFKELAIKLTEPDSDLPIKIIPTRIVRSKAEAFEHYRALLKQGKEGTILKSPQAIWEDKTSKDQVKLKLEVDVDLKVTGIVDGNIGTKNEGRPGSLACESSCGTLKVDVTVKNEALRDAIEANPSDYIDRIIVVRANSIMQPSESNEHHSLFLPRMVEAGYRTDKTEADSLERIKDIFEAATQG